MYLIRIFLIALLVVSGAFEVVAQVQKKVLIFTKTTGFRHASIPKGVHTVEHLLEQEGISYRHSENSDLFQPDSLKQFDALIFLHTTGDLFNEDQKLAFQKFIRSGKGYLGIHAASDTEFGWSWYGDLVGAYFSRHPKVQEAKIHVINRKHISTRHLPKIWIHKDEWYDFKEVRKGLHFVLDVDEQSYEGGGMGKFHPIAWYQEFDGGRSFYTGLGHTSESFDSELFQKHILGGIRYVLDL